MGRVGDWGCWDLGVLRFGGVRMVGGGLLGLGESWDLEALGFGSVGT